MSKLNKKKIIAGGVNKLPDNLYQKYKEEIKKTMKNGHTPKDMFTAEQLEELFKNKYDNYRAAGLTPNNNDIAREVVDDARRWTFNTYESEKTEINVLSRQQAETASKQLKKLNIQINPNDLVYGKVNVKDVIDKLSTSLDITIAEVYALLFNS